MVFGRRTTLKVALLFLLNTGMRPEEMLAVRAESIVFDGNGTIISITGHTCLGISLVWGLAGFVWLKPLLPIAYDVIDHIPTHVQQALATALAAFLAVDVAFTISPPSPAGLTARQASPLTHGSKRFLPSILTMSS